MDEITPVKVAIGEYLTRWYNFLVPTTQSVKEFTERGVSKSIVWASDRMVDAAEDMLASYRKTTWVAIRARMPSSRLYCWR
jgi:hypothetical protein